MQFRAGSDGGPPGDQAPRSSSPWRRTDLARTYHLAHEREWAATAGEESYAPSAYETEGFIHCTDGEAEIIATANRHYREHPGPFLVLEVDLDRVDVPVRYEDERRIYPHVFGRLPRAAVAAVVAVERAEDGTFLRFGEATRP